LYVFQWFLYFTTLSSERNPLPKIIFLPLAYFLFVFMIAAPRLINILLNV
jgi:hypothetical protein